MAFSFSFSWSFALLIIHYTLYYMLVYRISFIDKYNIYLFCWHHFINLLHE